jgi:uncharacterized protein (DUF427 family)
MDVIKTPGPEHPITVVGFPGRIQAMFNGHVIADSGDVLILKEASYKAVAYFPRADVEMSFLARTRLDTYCPYKGHAAYFSISRDGEIAENAVWTYETPHPAMEIIKDRLAFYPHYVDMHVVSGPASAAGDAVMHTDSGSGSSQAEHWTVTAPNPPVEV